MPARCRRGSAARLRYRSGAPNTTVTNTAFGTVAETQANDPRSVQLQFRISY